MRFNVDPFKALFAKERTIVLYRKWDLPSFDFITCVLLRLIRVNSFYSICADNRFHICIYIYIYM